MPNLTIKNVPTTLYQSLKKRALTHHRSLNSEVIVCLEFTLRAPRLDTDDLIQRARALRHRLSRISINDSLISKAKRHGRA